MVVSDFVVQAYLEFLGGAEIYFNIMATLFIFTVIYFFHKVSE